MRRRRRRKVRCMRWVNIYRMKLYKDAYKPTDVTEGSEGTQLIVPSFPLSRVPIDNK